MIKDYMTHCSPNEIKHVIETFRNDIGGFIDNNHQNYKQGNILDMVSDFLGQYNNEPYNLLYIKFLKWNVPMHIIDIYAFEEIINQIMSKSFEHWDCKSVDHVNSDLQSVHDIDKYDLYKLANDHLDKYNRSSNEMIRYSTDRNLTLERCLFASAQMVYSFGMDFTPDDIKDMDIEELRELVYEACDDEDGPFDSRAANEFLRRINE